MRRHIVFQHRGPRSAPAQAIQPAPPAALYLDAYLGTVTTAAPLAAGRAYIATITGTVSDWNEPLPRGQAEADAMFPSRHEARASTEVGLDAATVFALPAWSSRTLGAWPQLEVDLHDGRNWQRLVPIGGPFQTPQPGHAYRYALTGAGQPVTFRWADDPLADNYGMLRIDVIEQAGS